MKKNNIFQNFKYTLVIAVVVSAISLGSMACSSKTSNSCCKADSISSAITEQEVLNAQKQWSDGIVNIGSVFTAKGDYKAAAEKHIDNLYGYNMGPVLFKPTLASEKQFRTDKESALSYFVGGNPKFTEDHGFAIKPWSSIRWESTGIKIVGNMAVAMGNYYFTPANGGEEVKVEYSFAYTKDKVGKLRIILHDSHLPYKPESKH